MRRIQNCILLLSLPRTSSKYYESGSAVRLPTCLYLFTLQNFLIALNVDCEEFGQFSAPRLETMTVRLLAASGC